jgi:hypothetical protein
MAQDPQCNTDKIGKYPWGAVWEDRLERDQLIAQKNLNIHKPVYDRDYPKSEFKCSIV